MARLSDLVLAAGGVVWRREENGEVEVLVIHRPKYHVYPRTNGEMSTQNPSTAFI